MAAKKPTQFQSKQTYHLTKRGDTLQSLSKQYKVPIKLLTKANKWVKTPTATEALPAKLTIRVPAMDFDAFGKVTDGWVEIGPIWYQKGVFVEPEEIIT